MKLVIDIEANSLVNPKDIWVVVCKDIDTGALHIFREVTKDADQLENLHHLLSCAVLLVGHNICSYDLRVLHSLIGFQPDGTRCRVVDTYILSKLRNYSREAGHSLESWGEELGISKIKFNDFKQYSREMEEYCVRDVGITYKLYCHFANMLADRNWDSSIQLEHDFQSICNSLHDNGFAFNSTKATKLLARVTEEIQKLDGEIDEAFPPRLRMRKLVTPKYTKYGTLNRSDFRWITDGNVGDYNGGPFSLCEWYSFNPNSHKQLIDVLNTSGWKPEDKTQGHVDTERELNRLKYSHIEDKDLRVQELTEKLNSLKIYGWRVNEQNLSTLPESAPPSAKSLAKRLLLESRRRTLTEWLGLVQEDGRIHGDFVGIGAWTHRMAHQKPNTANIPRPLNINGSTKLLGKELRELWIAPKGKILVGVDAEGIQLRIFAHYINDEEFTDALVRGRKDNKTDPHSLNARILGGICKSRDAAKRFVYALLLGGGISKLSAILEASEQDTKEALDRLLRRYTGFKFLREEVFPKDAQRGWFEGLDGRRVPIPEKTVGGRKHLAMSGYLQNGEAIVIKRAALIASGRITQDDDLRSWKFVDIVHDELQSECKNDMRIALKVAEIKAQAIKEAGEYYKLKCPMAGSYWNEGSKDYTIGTNWYQTH